MTKALPPLEDSILASRGIAHGFGQKGSAVPRNAVFPKQVHGVDVFRTGAESTSGQEADAIVSEVPDQTVAIVTADCVPILVATAEGTRVAAIHAGWRGLSAGVIETGLEAIRGGDSEVPLVAAIGPAARGCCYEVDEPVRRGLARRYSHLLDGVLEPRGSGHFMLDLPRLAARVIRDCGVESTRIGTEQRHCTICDSVRFESYRRAGAEAGRLQHFITGKAPMPRQA